MINKKLHFHDEVKVQLSCSLQVLEDLCLSPAHYGLKLSD